MKARTLIIICASLVVVFVILMSASCENGETEYGYFMYDGNKYPMAHAVLRGVGAINGSYEFQFAASSSGCDAESFLGTMDSMEIILYSSTSTLAESTYIIVHEGQPNWRDPDTAEFLGLMINVICQPSGPPISGTQIIAESGTIKVRNITPDNIGIDFNVTLKDGVTSTGTYSGPYTF